MGERLRDIVNDDGTMAAGHTEAKQMTLSVFKLKYIYIWVLSFKE